MQSLPKVNIPYGMKLSQEDLYKWWTQTEITTRDFYDEVSRLTKFDLKTLDALQNTSSSESLFATDMWQKHLEQIRNFIIQGRRDILQDELVRYAIYLFTGSAYLSTQLKYLEEKYQHDYLKFLLRESTTLIGYIVNHQYYTSEIRVHHLTHLTVFQYLTKVDLMQLKVVVEFGGGYGGFTNLLKRINPELTIIVIDFPELLIINKHYNESQVSSRLKVFTQDDDQVQEGYINYISVFDIEKYTELISCDLFVATWSLSEANSHTQNFVDSTAFFNAKHVLYGYRSYEIPNPRQPNSNLTALMRSREHKSIHVDAFWSINGDHRYYFF